MKTPKVLSERKIFRRGSTTYYFSSSFFPKAVRDDVFRLYSFVRVADDYVDEIPQDRKEFKALRGMWEEASNALSFRTERSPKDTLNERVIKNIVYVCRKYQFENEWVEAFFDSMQADLDNKKYTSIDGSLWYVYGSAEVIGLMMAYIMRLPKDAYPYAMLQGRAMQWINFIRDIQEDNTLGRCYFPAEDLQRFKLLNLSKQEAIKKPSNFEALINYELERYEQWQAEANQGLQYIDYRLRVPLQTAIAMYDWTAREIKKDPMIVFERKIKPQKLRVLRSGIFMAMLRNRQQP